MIFTKTIIIEFFAKWTCLYAFFVVHCRVLKNEIFSFILIDVLSQY